MKICQITDGFPPQKGGVETHNYTLVKYLVQKGYEVDVIVLRPSTFQEWNINSSFEGFMVHNLFCKQPFLWSIHLRKIMKKIEEDKVPDVYDVHKSALMPAIALKRNRTLLSLHFFELTCPLDSLGMAWPRPCPFHSMASCREHCGVPPSKYLYWKTLSMYAIMKSQKIMVKLRSLRDILVKSGVKKDKIVIVPHWVDVEGIKRKSNVHLRQSIKSFDESDYVFGFFGRLAWENGVDLLIDAFSILTKKRNNIKTKLMIIGDGDLRRKLELSVAARGLSNKVIFFGMQPYEEVHRYLSVADAIVNPHRFMNYNWSLIEAMCTEKPIVATNVFGTTDILHDEFNALLASPSPSSLASKMEDLLDDPTKGKAIAQRAFETVKEKHSLRNLLKYEELIRSIRTE